MVLKRQAIFLNEWILAFIYFRIDQNKDNINNRMMNICKILNEFKNKKDKVQDIVVNGNCS